MAKKEKNEVKVEQTLDKVNDSKIDIVIQLLKDIKQLLEEKKTKEQNENRWRI